YIYVNCFEERVSDPPALARVISDRNTGVGSDGLILIFPSDKADARFEIYNMDGSRGQMCGNGSRCVAKYVYDHGLSRRNPLRIDTDAGCSRSICSFRMARSRRFAWTWGLRGCPPMRSRRRCVKTS